MERKIEVVFNNYFNLQHLFWKDLKQLPVEKSSQMEHQLRSILIMLKNK